MRFAGTQTVYPCKEHETVVVPIGLLLGKDGNLDVYPAVAGKAYFDINYRQGQLSLRSRGFVGLIPISNKVAIHVEPRTPIGNLLYMIWRAGLKLSTLEGFIRGYQISPQAVESAEEVYVSTFINALREMKSKGVLKKHKQRESQVEKRGRLLIGPTVSRFRSRGLRQHHVFQVHELTTNNRENQILKYTVERLLRYFLHDLSGENRQVAIELRELSSLLAQADGDSVTPGTIAREAIGLIRGLPNSHRFYESALWLSYLIAIRAGVSMERVGSAKFESVIIDVADVFENYVRALCEEASTSHFGGCRVLDGNKSSVPLFIGNSVFQTQPDYYFRRNGQSLAVADAKYKPKLSTEDRYALIAFCEALQVRKAAFVCPQFANDRAMELHGTTRGGIDIHVLRIDLSADDLRAEETRFKSELAVALSLA